MLDTSPGTYVIEMFFNNTAADVTYSHTAKIKADAQTDPLITFDLVSLCSESLLGLQLSLCGSHAQHSIEFTSHCIFAPLSARRDQSEGRSEGQGLWSVPVYLLLNRSLAPFIVVCVG